MRLFCRGGLAAMAMCLVVTAAALAQSGNSALTPGARVAIVGDSITEQKLYSKYMEAYLVACSGVPDVKVFQFGWGGETAGGFANRLENDLGTFKPTIVTLCYGMNDGGYQPYRPEIGAGYEGAMRNVLKKLDAAGIKSIVVGSPGAVDTYFFRPGQMMGDKPSHIAYNDTLAHLRDIDRKLAEETKQRFADVHAAMFDAMTKANAALGKEYDVCGRDGFHPGPNGQLAMAYAFLKGLGLDGNIGEITIDMKGAATGSAGHKTTGSAGTAEVESTRWPFCFDADAKSSNSTRSITPFLPFNQDLNRYVLKVKGLEAAKAKVTWGNESKEFTREQLTTGINLAAEFSATPFDGAFQKYVAALGNKQAFETYMIKSVITNFRSFPDDLKSDAELQQALQVVRGRLLARQEKLDADARALLVPVTHTITVAAVQ
ncbi:MAG TPA: SGNH/GDSL hydrolase family protein [Pirellulaceae bacterium]|nr:SGNH/GDSL hydrolase family protein [Pirellulaceae bacterium]